MNGNVYQMSTEEESLDGEECWMSNKENSNVTKDSNCDVNQSSEICNHNGGNESEIIINSDNCNLFLKRNNVHNNDSEFITEKVNVSGLVQDNDVTKKKYQQAQESTVQNNLSKDVKVISECSKSKESNTNDVCQIKDSALCCNMDNIKLDNKSTNGINYDGIVSEQELPTCTSEKNCNNDYENMLVSDSCENQLFYNISDDDSDEDSLSMRLDDELKKAIEDNLKKEIGAAFNINSSGRMCNDIINIDHEKSVSVNINKQQYETVTLYNSVSNNIEGKITIHDCESNNNLSKSLYSSKQQESVKIHIAEMKESVMNFSKISQVGNASKLDSKSYFASKHHKCETLALSKNKLHDNSCSTGLFKKSVSFQNSENSDVCETLNEPSCSYKQLNHAKSDIKEKTITSDKGSLSTPKVIVIKKNNLSEDNRKLCDNSQVLQSKNVKLLMSSNVKSTSQNIVDESTPSVVKSSFKIVPVQKTVTGVVHIPSSENLVETVFQKQILVPQIPVYSTPGLIPTRAFKCDYCGDRYVALIVFSNYSSIIFFAST